MAISNYLFHSQYPTPEKWVHKHKPCESFDRELFEFVVTGTSTSTSPAAPLKDVMTQTDYTDLHNLCRELMTKKKNNNSSNSSSSNSNSNSNSNEEYYYKSFYEGLRNLEPYDGLRLATIQFLLGGNKHSGGDLLRMTNNLIRLNEWQKHKQKQQQQQGSSSNTKVLHTIRMNDWLQNYTETAFRASEFLVNDLFAAENGEIGGTTVDADSTRVTDIAAAKHDFSRAVSSSMVEAQNIKKQGGEKIILRRIFGIVTNDKK